MSSNLVNLNIFYRLVWQLLLSNLWHLFNFKNVWIVYCKARNKLVVFNVNPVYTLGFNFRTCSERTIPGDPYWKKLGSKASSRKKAKLNKGTSYSSAWYKLLLKPRKFNISQFYVEYRDSLYWLLMTSPKWLLGSIIPFRILTLSKIRRNVSADLVTKKNITKVHKDTSFI